MKRNRIFSIFTLACTLLAACDRIQEPDGPSPEELTPIEVSVKASDGIVTRGIITGTSLPDRSQIGLTFCDISGTKYHDQTYENVCYYASGDVPSQSWDSESPVMVSNTPGTLYGYFPYDSAIADITSIPVKADSENQTDYMYATPVANMSKANASAAVVMNHALAAVRITLTRGTYTGTGKVTGACVSGADIATSAVLNARTGSLTKVSGYSTDIAADMNEFTLNETGSSVDILVVPCCSAGQTMKVGLTIDGNEYTAEIPNVSISQGRMTECKISVNEGEVYVTNVNVTAWKQNAAGSQIIQKDYKVSLAGNMEGLSFSNSVDEDGNVTILAVPYISDDAETRPVSIEGNATLEQSVNEETGVLTIRLTDIASDVTVNFDGYYLWLTFKHEITDISQPTKLHNITNMTYYLSRQKLDGVEMDPVKEYQFTTTGEHILKLAFVNPKVFPSSAFYYVPTVTEAILPEGVESMGSWTFIGSQNLRKILLPSTLKSIGYQTFECTGIESCVIPDGCAMSYGIFDDCNSLTYAKLPSDMTEIPDGTFSGCSSLAQFEMPAGVTKIGHSAFESTALETFAFPDAVSVIDEEVLMNCKNLKEIRLPANATTIGRQAFYNCTSLERTILPDDSIHEGEFVIPEGVISVDYLSMMFQSPGIKSISVPTTLTEIANGGLASSMVERYTLSGPHVMYDIRNNSLVETATNRLIAGGTQSTKIHESVTVLGHSSFLWSKIENVDLHAGITNIEDRAFYFAYPKQVISRSVTPPALGTECFWIAQYNGVLRVPEEGLTAYREQWMINELGYLGWSTARWSLVALQEGE